MVITLFGENYPDDILEDVYWSKEKGGLSCPREGGWEPRLRWEDFISNGSEEGGGCRTYLEVELINPSMDVRVEKEKLRKRPNVWFEKVNGERNLQLSLELGRERARWAWEVEIRPESRWVCRVYGMSKRDAW